jgi:conjugative relaxase-like TrwC/TraI family protein
MLSIGKLGPGQAQYYLDQAGGPVTAVAGVSSGVEDYYVKGSEPHGRWCGRAAAAVELSGEVEPADLRAMLEGRRPDGTVLRERGSVPGFDVTFSAPKSVSVLFAVGGERVRTAVLEAHDEAVREALGFLEDYAAVTRRGAGGATLVTGNGLVAAAFLHRTSRAGDPQVHTHVLVANMTRGPEGKWTALDARALYRNGRTAGYLYQAALREAMTRRLGVAWGRVAKGQAEIDGVPDRVLRAFSRRRAEIDEALREHGTRGSRAARFAALATRRSKDYGVTAESLANEWHRRAVEQGLSRRRIESLLHRRDPAEMSPRDWEPLFDALAGPEGLTRETSAFARGDVIRALCGISPRDIGAPAILSAADAFIEDRAVRLLERDAADPEPRYSTPEMLAVERRVLTTALHLRGAKRGVAAPRAVEVALARAPQLGDEQVAMVRGLTASGDGVAVVIGKAGAGKTTALAVAREAWEASGVPIRGCAVGRRAATQLEHDAGIRSASVAAVLLRDDLEQGAVLVVDEAGMLGTRSLDQLLQRVNRAGGKLVLTGDPEQLPAIDAGGGLRGVAARVGHIELTENRRQDSEWERAALDLLRHGEIEPALERYDENGRLTLGKRGDEVVARLMRDWRAAGDPIDSVIIAHRRADVADLNARARAAMAQAGRLGERAMTARGGSFSAGDVIVVRKNARRLAVSNGDRGVVGAVDASGLHVRFEQGYRFLPREFLDSASRSGNPAVELGYAITAYVAQGLTCGRSFVLARDDIYREWAYTAMSRGRASNRLYLVDSDDAARHEIAPAEPAGDPRDTLIAGLTRSRRERMAIDLGRDR